MWRAGKGRKGRYRKVVLFLEQNGLILTPALLWILKRIVQWDFPSFHKHSVKNIEIVKCLL